MITFASIMGAIMLIAALAAAWVGEWDKATFFLLNAMWWGNELDKKLTKLQTEKRVGQIFLTCVNFHYDV